jgi:ribosomal protein L21
MYAVIETGGKQYKVTEGLIFKAERLNGPEAEVGKKLNLKVLLLEKDGEVLTGKEAEKAVVEAEVTYLGKGPKIHIFKYNAKKNYRRRQGHRQPFTELKITSIKA